MVIVFVDVCSSHICVDCCVLCYTAVVNIHNLRLYHRQTVSAKGNWSVHCSMCV